MRPAWRYAVCAAALSLASAGSANAATRKSDEERRAEYERFVDKMMDAMPAEELAEELAGVLQRTMDTERRDRRRRELERDFDTNDEALLERIGRLVVQWVNTRLTPRTDDECSWNWGRWRCDPQCNCMYRYRFGDYAPGRSCRLRPENERGLPTCDPEAGNDVSLLEKLASFVGRVAKGTWRFTAEHVIPQTDKECRFSLAHSLEERRLVCSPRKRCSFRYKFGDMHPGRSCRIRKPGDEYSKSASRGAAAPRTLGAGPSPTFGERSEEHDEDDDLGFFDFDDEDYLL